MNLFAPLRRRRSILAGVVLLAAGVVAGQQFTAWRRGVGAEGFERSPGVAVDPAGTPGAGAVAFFALEDTGDASEQRAAVVARMSERQRTDPVDFVVLLGDSFYPSGVCSPTSPRFDEDFEAAFPVASLPLPFHAALGNHDPKGSVQAEVDHSALSERWRMPARHYELRRTAADGASLQLLVLDTDPIVRRAPEASAQLAWIAERLSSTDARWRIAVGHHPLLPGGKHGIARAIRDDLGPVLRAGRVDLYLSGQEHDLQLLQDASGLLQAISGAGSELRRAGKADDTLYAVSAPGFVTVRADGRGLSVRFDLTDGRTHEHLVARRAD